MNAEFAPLLKLGRAEHLQLVEDLWDSMEQEEAELPLSDAKRDELRRRQERFQKHPASARTWDHLEETARTRNDLAHCFRARS